VGTIVTVPSAGIKVGELDAHAEAAWDEVESGVPTSEVAPFWRVVDPKSPLAKKLRAGGDWIEQQRAAEREE
jgi:hypothetical protein